MGKSRTGSASEPHPYLENGGYEPHSGRLDWSLPDSFSRFSRYFPFDVNHRSRAIGRHVTRLGIGIFLFPLNPHHGSSNLLRSAEVPPSWSREPDRNIQHRYSWLDTASHRLCSLIHHRLRLGRVVYGVGTTARIRTLCGVSDYFRNRRPNVDVQGRIADISYGPGAHRQAATVAPHSPAYQLDTRRRNPRLSRRAALDILDCHCCLS